MAEWRRTRGLRADWWQAWRAAASCNGRAGILCQNCGYPYVRYGKGLWFHHADTDEGWEQGFCTNLACAEAPLSGWWGPGQIIVETFLRFGLPSDPPDRGARPLRALPMPPAERRSTRREREARAHPYAGASDRHALRRVEPDLRADEGRSIAGPEPAAAEPVLTVSEAAVGASRAALLPAAPKVRPPATPTLAASEAADAEISMSSPVRPAA